MVTRFPTLGAARFVVTRAVPPYMFAVNNGLAHVRANNLSPLSRG
nr:MAG TPA: hypothetical protein [Caudoviricetes sp.]